MAGKNGISSGAVVQDNGSLNENVSAMLDGEVGHLSSEELTAAIEDEFTRASWVRYQMIGEVVRESALHRGRETLIDSSFAEKVRIEIDAEPTVLAPTGRIGKRERPSYLQPLAGVALAASVAGIAVIGLQQTLSDSTENPQPLSVANISAAEQVLTPAAVAEGGANSPTPELEIDLAEHKRRLNSYLVNFNEQRAGLGVPGVNPYVRIIDFESEK